MFVGVPYDGGTTYQPGARMAPYHLRRVSALVQTWNPRLEVDVFRALRCGDGGNVAFPPFDREAASMLVEQTVSAIASARARPFVVGGDHSVALPALRALARAHGPVAVVHVDAHLDTSGPETWGAEHHHGTPFRHALAEGLIAAGQLHHVGIRGSWGHPEEDAFTRGHHSTVVFADELAERGVAEVADGLQSAIGDRPCYLSFDIDAVDPAFAPGTGTPVPGGLTSREALSLVRGLAGLDLVGADLVEVAPALDHADITCHLAAHLLFEAAAVVAARK